MYGTLLGGSLRRERGTGLLPDWRGGGRTRARIVAPALGVGVTLIAGYESVGLSPWFEWACRASGSWRACHPHVDANGGLSYIAFFGPYAGGELCIGVYPHPRHDCRTGSGHRVTSRFEV